MNFVESTEFQSTYFLASREHPTSPFSCFCQKIEIFGAELIFSKEIIFFLGPQLKECNSELTPPCKRGVKFPGMKWCCSNHHYHTNEQKKLYIIFSHRIAISIKNMQFFQSLKWQKYTLRDGLVSEYKLLHRIWMED